MSLMVESLNHVIKLLDAHMAVKTVECGNDSKISPEAYLVQLIAKQKADVNVQLLSEQMAKLRMAEIGKQEALGGAREAAMEDVLPEHYAIKIASAGCPTWHDLMKSSLENFSSEIESSFKGLSVAQLKLIAVARFKYKLNNLKEEARLALLARNHSLLPWDMVVEVASASAAAVAMDADLDAVEADAVEADAAKVDAMVCIDKILSQNLEEEIKGLAAIEVQIRRLRTDTSSVISVKHGSGTTGQLMEAVSHIFKEVSSFLERMDTDAQFPRDPSSKYAFRDMLPRHHQQSITDTMIYSHIQAGKYFISSVVQEQKNKLSYLVAPEQSMVVSVLTWAKDSLINLIAKQDISQAKRTDCERLLKSLNFRLSENKDLQDANFLDAILTNFRAGRELVPLRAAVKPQTWDGVLLNLHDRVHDTASHKVRQAHAPDCRFSK